MNCLKSVFGVAGAAGIGLVFLNKTSANDRHSRQADKDLYSGKFNLEAKSPLSQRGSNGSFLQWDSNWDRRDPSSLVKPLKDNATPEQAADYVSKLDEAKSKATRFIVMVRHGQYNLDGVNDSERTLTELGRQQADMTGKRIAELYNYLYSRSDENGNRIPMKMRLVKSTMTRATETADIILKHLPGVEDVSCDLVREGAPIPPDPPLSGWSPDPSDFFQEGARIEAGFRKYFHRAPPQQEETSIDILVCHGNVIRYCVCRALQLPPEAWLRLAVHNGSISVITITPSGRVKCSQLGEAGHFPPNLLTFN